MVLINQLLVAFPLAVIFFPLVVVDPMALATVPNLAKIMRDLVIFILVQEVVSYYLHRWQVLLLEENIPEYTF